MSKGYKGDGGCGLYLSIFLSGIIALFAYVSNRITTNQPINVYVQPTISMSESSLPSIFTDGPFNEAGNDEDLVAIIKQYMGRVGGGSGYHNCNYIITAGHTTDGVEFTFEGYSKIKILPSEFLIYSDDSSEYVNRDVPDINISKAPASNLCLPIGQAPNPGDKVQIFGHKSESSLIDGYVTVTSVDMIYFGNLPSQELIGKVEPYGTDFGGFSGGIGVINNEIVSVTAGGTDFENIVVFRLDYIETMSPETYAFMTDQVFSYTLQPIHFSSQDCDSELKDALCTNLADNNLSTYWTNDAFQAPFSKIDLYMNGPSVISNLEINWGQSCMNEYYLDIYQDRFGSPIEFYVNSDSRERIEIIYDNSIIYKDVISLEQLFGQAISAERIRISPILPCENAQGRIETEPTFSIYEIIAYPPGLTP